MLNNTLIPGGIIAEFSDGNDARAFCIHKGFTAHVVTGGINLPFAVRPLIKAKVMPRTVPESLHVDGCPLTEEDAAIYRARIKDAEYVSLRMMMYGDVSDARVMRELAESSARSGVTAADWIASEVRYSENFGGGK